ncbi:MAG: alpha/beta hydrolase family protein, partial [bacterium]
SATREEKAKILKLVASNYLLMHGSLYPTYRKPFDILAKGPSRSIWYGEIDSNSGTYPLQSQRLFHALKGHGATARLVMLPHEGHGYSARESVLHVLAEMIEWFDRYVKNTK